MIEGFKAECSCTPQLESMEKRKDGLYEFRVKQPGKWEEGRGFLARLTKRDRLPTGDADARWRRLAPAE